MTRSKNTIICIILLLILILVFYYRSTNQESFVNKDSSDEKYAMIIVEPREHKLLQSVIDLFDKRMESKWDLYVFHGKSHKDYAQKCVQNVKGRNIYIHSLKTDNLTADEYNALFREKSFWDPIDAEHILVFQTDAVPCRFGKFHIDDFLKYSYIGCPYRDRKHGRESTIAEGNSFYGIGGLSYRKKSLMNQCINRFPDLKFPEDIFASHCVDEFNLLKPTDYEMNQFCTQHYVEQPSFGAHKTDKDAPKEDREKLYTFCPEARILEGS